MHDDDHDLAQQALNLEIQIRSLKIGNSILRAEIEKLKRQLAAAEAKRKSQPKTFTAMTALVLEMVLEMAPSM